MNDTTKNDSFQIEIAPYLGAYADAIVSNIRLAVLSQQCRIIWVNEPFCDLTKYKEEELIGQSIVELNLAFGDPNFFRAVFFIISNGAKWSGEIKCKAKDGVVFWVKTTILPIKNSSGKIESYLLLNTNITPTKKALEEKDLALKKITQGEDRYRALVENQSDLISLCLADGTRIYVNDNYCNFFGKSFHELIGTNIQNLPLRGILPEFTQNIFKLSTDQPEASGIFHLENSLGEKLWVSLCIKGIFDSGGRLFEIITIGRDVTDLKNAELQKAKYIRDLEHIAFMTSHNVRGPIATMLGLVELLRMNAIHTEQWGEIVNSFKKCIVDLDGYTREMGAFIYEKQSGQYNGK
jgi:PAS domain S-box-containing protein